MPVTTKSPVPEPTTWDEYATLVQAASDELNVPPQFVKYMCTIELINEPWVEPETAKPSSIITPDRKIVVPPGVKL